jgi:hypothetical protein
MTSSINKNLTINTYQNIQNPVSNPVWNKLSYLTPVELTPPVKSKPSLDADSAKVKTIVQDAVKKYWGVYQQKFPEAFAMNKALKTATPEIVFIDDVKELGRIYPKHVRQSKGLNAFVVRENPNKIYIYMPNVTKDFQNFGSEATISTVCHELMHNVTNLFINRSINDSQGETQTYKNVKGDLRDTINVPEKGRKKQITSFSVWKLLVEGSSDTLSIEATGINSKFVPYQAIRDLSKELQKNVGLDVYRKAFISNDPKAYKIVIEAALDLKKIYDEKVKFSNLEELKIIKSEIIKKYDIHLS